LVSHILTGDSELEYRHGISIGEIFSIMRISKEGLRQVRKAEQAYEKKLNSFQVNLVGVAERTVCTTSTPVTHYADRVP
jgi:hypothetical protein